MTAVQITEIVIPALSGPDLSLADIALCPFKALIFPFTDRVIGGSVVRIIYSFRYLPQIIFADSSNFGLDQTSFLRGLSEG